METIKLYGIWDRKGERYDTPVFMLSDVFAKRWFYKLVVDGIGHLENFKDDFELHYLADFNVLTGKVGVTKARIVSTGIQIGKELEKNEKRNAA